MDLVYARLEFSRLFLVRLTYFLLFFSRGFGSYERPSQLLPYLI